MDMIKESSVKVAVCSFESLTAAGTHATEAELPYKLALDNYQRPYVWSRLKIEQLLDDLQTFSQQQDQQSYYMGSILLHRNTDKKSLFVIDGQQRLSSLAVLFYNLKGYLPKGLAFKYRSPLSAQNLSLAQKTVKEVGIQNFNDRIFEQLQFTVITVDSEDLAFTFFDTQNNRGVPLKATDLLKAYHLRAVNNGHQQYSEQLQQHCARRWEDVQIAGEKSKVSRENDFAPELFSNYLWRARNWKGQNDIDRETHDMLLDTFQRQSIQPKHVDEVSLYPAHSNQFAAKLCLQNTNEYRLDLQPVAVTSNAASLPLSLRQPVHKGIGFFLYAQKYAALLNALFHDGTDETELLLFRNFYGQVVMANSYYLRELFKLAVLMYADQFGTRMLVEFAQRLEHVLGSIRLDKHYIFKEAPLKYLKDSSHNLLDVIAGSYRPQEVMDFLRQDKVLVSSYKALSKIVRGEGVRGRYLDALLTYYDKTELSNDHQWLDAVLKNKRIGVADA